MVNSSLFSSSVPHAPQTKSKTFNINFMMMMMILIGEAASMHIAFGEKIAIPSHVARTVSKNKVFVVVYYNHKIGLILVHFYL